jgi:predicted NBD/HSP70 family sugar kinase
MSRAPQEPAKDTLGALVLNLHECGGAASRAELTEQLGCGRSVMGYLLGELTSRGLVTIDRASGRTPGAEGGRPSHLVQIADDAPVVLAAQLSPDTVSAARIGLGGRVFERIEHTLPSGTAADALVELCQLLGELSSPDTPVLGIGLAVPSPVRLADGYARAALHLGWPAVPMLELFRAELDRHDALHGLPADLANDANLAALAEYRHGAGRGAVQLLYLATGHVGLGGALISDGRLFRGTRGYAIEPGHITVDPAGAACVCGSTGCLEIEADHRGLLRALGHDTVPLTEVTAAVARALDAATAGDPVVLAAIRQINAHLGSGLASLVNITDTDRIVLGGTLGRLYELEPAAVRDRIAERSFLSDGFFGTSSAGDGVARGGFPPGDNDIEIVGGELADSTLLGAAELALQPLLADPKRTLDALRG